MWPEVPEEAGFWASGPGVEKSWRSGGRAASAPSLPQAPGCQAALLSRLRGQEAGWEQGWSWNFLPSVPGRRACPESRESSGLARPFPGLELQGRSVPR